MVPGWEELFPPSVIRERATAEGRARGEPGLGVGWGQEDGQRRPMLPGDSVLGQSGAAMSAAWLSVGGGSGLPPAQPASGEARKEWSDTQSVPCSQWLYFRHESVKKPPQD
jgi:hypothetical protein